ncbi:hypothetical protein EON65_04995 [archaeon]|nr:MAG: hypothetical protein EON65_04995 [archaeon]
MALQNISKFNWEKILSKAEQADVKRALNLLRGKSNEITAAHAKFGRAPEPVDFAAYKKKLRFTSSAVETLEKAYQSKQLPKFTAEVPSLEAKKRAMLLQAVDNIVNAAQAELTNLNQQLVVFEQNRINKDTRYNDIVNRFPVLAKEVEQEIKHHEWAK